MAKIMRSVMRANTLITPRMSLLIEKVVPQSRPARARARYLVMRATMLVHEVVDKRTAANPVNDLLQDCPFFRMNLE